MKIKFLLLSSLIFVGGMTMKVSAASYADGIEYFKSGQPDRAKIILQRTFNDASTNKAEACYYLGEIYSGMQKNCLLYTTPSPRDTFRSRMPSSA